MILDNNFTTNYNYNIMFDMHLHTKYSSDSKETLDNICKSALEKGLKGIAFTDHATIYKYEELGIYNNFTKCKEEIFRLKKKYEGKLTILFGAEISEAYANPQAEQEILNLDGLDVVLCSIHDNMPIEHLGADTFMRKNDFNKLPKEKTKQILKIYYDILKHTAKNNDYDVLAHLTYPFRYINCRDNANYDMFEFKSEFEEILNTLIKRDKALELNTSMSYTDFFMPNEEILLLYKKLGGKLITIGSDAHTANNVATGFDKAINLLKKCGFDTYYYYKNRKPIPVKI